MRFAFLKKTCNVRLKSFLTFVMHVMSERERKGGVIRVGVYFVPWLVPTPNINNSRPGFPNVVHFFVKSKITDMLSKGLTDW